ncbi:hypothetical protein ACT5KS_001094 [Campylobacter coli]
MKKFFILFFALLSFLKAEPSLDELADFTPMFAIRSLETGISLSPFRKTSKSCRRKNKISIWKNKTSIKVEILFFYKA